MCGDDGGWWRSTYDFEEGKEYFCLLVFPLSCLHLLKLYLFFLPWNQPAPTAPPHHWKKTRGVIYGAAQLFLYEEKKRRRRNREEQRRGWDERTMTVWIEQKRLVIRNDTICTSRSSSVLSSSVSLKYKKNSKQVSDLSSFLIVAWHKKIYTGFILWICATLYRLMLLFCTFLLKN